jgi:fatty acid desaturase
MPRDRRQPTDVRRYRRQTDRRLLVAVLVMLVVVGSALIGLIYGWRSIFTALLCLLPGALIIVLLWLFLYGIERLMADGDS